MTRLDFDPDLERLGDALRASTTIDLAREQQAARSAPAGRGGHVAGARVRPRRRRHRSLAASTLGLAGVGAALVLALGGSATSPAFAKSLSVTRQRNGSVLVKVNVNQLTSWVSPADRKLAAMGIDEQIALTYETGAPPVRGLINCQPLAGAAAPSGPPVKVLFIKQGTPVSSSGNTGAGNTTRVTGCAYYKTPGEPGTGNTGAS